MDVTFTCSSELDMSCGSVLSMPVPEAGPWGRSLLFVFTRPSSSMFYCTISGTKGPLSSEDDEDNFSELKASSEPFSFLAAILASLKTPSTAVLSHASSFSSFFYCNRYSRWILCWFAFEISFRIWRFCFLEAPAIISFLSSRVGTLINSNIFLTYPLVICRVEVIS